MINISTIRKHGFDLQNLKNPTVSEETIFIMFLPLLQYRADVQSLQITLLSHCRTSTSYLRPHSFILFYFGLISSNTTFPIQTCGPKCFTYQGNFCCFFKKKVGSIYLQVLSKLQWVDFVTANARHSANDKK